ncbi:Pol polyprotein [Candida maltosa Xu316]|uniref:Pol polyprotein n=1 Tax=Candida maltosa (strain Xu316) TaxID=1245528 RepID=M3JWW6_CANMX|nr:Pol polyprotein [Candida maltosa Xu316]
MNIGALTSIEVHLTHALGIKRTEYINQIAKLDSVDTFGDWSHSFLDVCHRLGISTYLEMGIRPYQGDFVTNHRLKSFEFQVDNFLRKYYELTIDFEIYKDYILSKPNVTWTLLAEKYKHKDVLATVLEIRKINGNKDYYGTKLSDLHDLLKNYESSEVYGLQYLAAHPHESITRVIEAWEEEEEEPKPQLSVDYIDMMTFQLGLNNKTYQPEPWKVNKIDKINPVAPEIDDYSLVQTHPDLYALRMFHQEQEEDEAFARQFGGLEDEDWVDDDDEDDDEEIDIGDFLPAKNFKPPSFVPLETSSKNAQNNKPTPKPKQQKPAVPPVPRKEFIIEKLEPNHIANHKGLFDSLDLGNKTPLYPASPGTGKIEGVGTVIIHKGLPNEYVMDHVLYVPTAKRNIFALRRFEENTPGGDFVYFTDDGAFIVSNGSSEHRKFGYSYPGDFECYVGEQRSNNNNNRNKKKNNYYRRNKNRNKNKKKTTNTTTT